MNCTVCQERIKASHNWADCKSGPHHLKCPCPDASPPVETKQVHLDGTPFGETKSASTCSPSACSWVVYPYATPRPCIILTTPPRFAVVFGEDNGRCPIVCESGDHPLLFTAKWRYVEDEKEKLS